ncbi:hypothetical protein [Mumia sp. ZJ430]|uniref:hypothetical protein n=1 Tax=Mumia sp. ZJ430 TaxID=2708083 RepID=UPI001FBB79C9|nr:hypothetical protein [Mumia sp. ZJ430]
MTGHPFRDEVLNGPSLVETRLRGRDGLELGPVTGAVRVGAVDLDERDRWEHDRTEGVDAVRARDDVKALFDEVGRLPDLELRDRERAQHRQDLGLRGRRVRGGHLLRLLEHAPGEGFDAGAPPPTDPAHRPRPIPT